MDLSSPPLSFGSRLTTLLDNERTFSHYFGETSPPSRPRSIFFLPFFFPAVADNFPPRDVHEEMLPPFLRNRSRSPHLVRSPPLRILGPPSLYSFLSDSGTGLTSWTRRLDYENSCYLFRPPSSESLPLHPHRFLKKGIARCERGGTYSPPFFPHSRFSSKPSCKVLRFFSFSYF